MAYQQNMVYVYERFILGLFFLKKKCNLNISKFAVLLKLLLNNHSFNKTAKMCVDRCMIHYIICLHDTYSNELITKRFQNEIKRRTSKDI